ncbi:hypothetical protein PHYSODRAFT_286666 [Phytophthora sojae]|uniref:Uncharacterized protein n=1 Tax=Phytophthora sojae (strain P6497) TaxID=1094619 RepID=G4ZV44_PHYSP|nr:hypothetical protein PHYSODRAFT_286666 [Phytophthora sojae]EGZ13668.1 hypothetical protein PHYSODRAFT_286666 [Phytophthora sojae]|eukprot:XP_009531097.1 hypothetical protein PHYSODRAFT_286666 [Phytophthora sojae]
MRSPLTTPLATAPASPSAASTSSADGVNLSAALTALKVSLKRDLESFAPPTPAVSPVHGRSANKRARFDFGSIEEETEADAEEQQRVKAPAAPVTTNALLAVSNRIKFELEKRRRRDRERAQKPRRRKQLSYFAIVGAFQRAAHEREVAVQLECVVEASTD